MTAEIAIANSAAVALAADSAVTIGNVKIYNTAEKLFGLSKNDPVGIMIFGNASLMSIPWDTIIKMYRQSNNSSFNKLEQYGLDFIRYLENDFGGFDEATQKKFIEMNVQGYLTTVQEEFIFKEVEKHINIFGKITDEETKKILKKVIYDCHKQVSSTKRLPTFTLKYERDFKKQHKATIREVIKNVFKKYDIPSDCYTKLYDIAVYLHSHDFFSEAKSGIVIAGFGKKDIFPVIDTYYIDGFYDGKLKCKKDEDKSEKINQGDECTVIPYAQEDMVDSFMRGVNPSVHKFIVRYLVKVFNRLPELIDKDKLMGTDDDKGEFIENYNNDIRKLLRMFFHQLDIHTNNEHIQPVMEMVNALPKDELAEMAESLVNLTAFKRRITTSPETVGGPIDVAVISKGDGFVWVKRKDYFPHELNVYNISR